MRAQDLARAPWSYLVTTGSLDWGATRSGQPVVLDARERRVEGIHTCPCEPHKPVRQIAGIGLLGGLLVVITPKERGGELAGQLRMLKRLIAASDGEQAVGNLATSGLPIEELARSRQQLQRLKLDLLGAHASAAASRRSETAQSRPCETGGVSFK